MPRVAENDAGWAWYGGHKRGCGVSWMMMMMGLRPRMDESVSLGCV